MKLFSLFWCKKKLWTTVVVMVFIIIGATMTKLVNVTSAPSATTIFADPPEVSNVEPGDTFLIRINVSEAPPSYAWAFRLGWDRTLLNVSGVEEGDFLHRWQSNPFPPPDYLPLYPTSRSVTPLDEANVKGEIYVSCALQGNLAIGDWATGNGWLVTLNFTVESTGSTLLNLFNTRLSDHLEGGYPASSPYPNNDSLFYNTSPPIHDIRITNIVASPSKVKAGEVANVSVTVLNEGTEAETITLYVNASTILIDTTVFTLNGTGSSENRSLTHTVAWNTTGVPGEEYTINAYVNPVPDEVDTADNLFLNSWMLHPISKEIYPVYTTVTVWWDHDVKVTEVKTSPSKVRVGETVIVDASTFNQGNFNETISVTVYADLNPTIIGDEIAVGTQTDIPLEIDGHKILSFKWNTTGVPEGTYTLSAYAPPVPGEVDPNIADNTFIDSTVTVLPLGYPVASFTYSPLKPLVGEPVAFHSSSYDDDGYIVSWEWDFNNDGVIDAITENSTWTYTETGEYTVRLIVTDNATLANDVQRLVTVYAPPVASFTYSPQNPLVNEAVTFDASASSDPDGTIAHYSWDFGDGQTGTGQTASHTYTSFGTYTVTLNVTDNDGFKGTESLEVHVREAPLASFTFSPSSPLAFQTITFDASSSTPNGGSITEYFWDFGDDNFANETDPITSHSYSPADTYTVTLTITDSEGLTNTATQSIVVGKLSSTTSMNVAPSSITRGEKVTITGSISPERQGVTVTILYRLSGAETWSVLGTVTTGDNSQYSYDWTPTAAGTYEVKAIWEGDANTVGDEGDIETITVQEASIIPDSTLLLIAGIIILIAVAVAIYFLKFRKQ